MADLNNFQLELGRASEVGLSLTLSLMMFSVALGLRMRHFSFLLHQPKLFLAGALSQMVGLPLLTLGLCFALDPPPSIALGMLLVACCPGGNVSNLLVVLARGNAALSVSLTATSSLAAALITPFSIVFWCALYPPSSQLLDAVKFDTVEFLSQTILILAVPLALGMLLARLTPGFADKIRPALVLVSTLGLLAIIGFALLKYADQFAVVGLGIIGLVVLHNACAFGLGFLTGRIVSADPASSRALTFETGIQNSGLAIVILLTQLSGLGGAATVAGLWGVWHIIAGLSLVVFFRQFPLPVRPGLVGGRPTADTQ